MGGSGGQLRVGMAIPEGSSLSCASSPATLDLRAAADVALLIISRRPTPREIMRSMGSGFLDCMSTSTAELTALTASRGDVPRPMPESEKIAHSKKD